ncbi:MAG: D-alanine--D-alanine ligase [Candidatus Omnitrophica bacterium]|nr:D-alanine--D-alanine ligase [Candidatus Omnitrophota bacterium]
MREKFGTIGVLMGGPSSERDISLKSGNAVYESLKGLGLNVVKVEIQSDDFDQNSRLIGMHNINCAFIALHGRYGEDGCIQELLEALDIPYTGSGVQASKTAMDKILSLEVCKKEGLDVPRYQVCQKSDGKIEPPDKSSLDFPLVVKPAAHGSSIGLSIIDTPDLFTQALDLAFKYDGKVILEEYIQGREITVGILAQEALPVIEIIPKKRFFDYEAKYRPGMTDYIVPARLCGETAQKAQDAALRMHRALDCFGCSRVDMILNSQEIPYILELNSIPGFTETSLLPKAAKFAGIEFSQLCLKLLELAFNR